MFVHNIGESLQKGWVFVDPLDYDDIIYSNLPVVVAPNKDCIDFLISYLAEWRVLFKHEWFKKRKIILYNKDGFYDTLLKCLSEYRFKLPDEHNEEAREWFIYPNIKLDDIFIVTGDIEEIEVIAEEYSNKEYFSAKPKSLGESSTNCFRNKKNRAFVAAAAFGWEMYDDLAYKLGKDIADNDMGFINGGPDGGKYCNGPMRKSALGYISVQNSTPIIAVYSELVFENFVKPEQLEKFSGKIEYIHCGTEAERKTVMINNADIVYALPGAIGTWAEVTYALMRNKKVVLVGDYWRDFKECLNHYSFDCSLKYEV